MDELGDRVEALLRAAAAPLTSSEIASQLNAPEDQVHRAVWSEPARFVWQPGHRWHLAQKKRGHRAVLADQADTDASESLRPKRSPALRATTLAKGLQLVVRQRPLDTEALFSVKSLGNEVELTLNAAHPAFTRLPLPFQDDGADDPFRRMLELLLEAWALCEDDLQGEQDRRAARALRNGWGRQLSELVQELL